MNTRSHVKVFTVAAVLLSALVFAGSVYANHAWGNYHWARKSNPFTLKLGDNLSSTWDPYLVTTSTDWSLSNVLDTLIVAGNNLSTQRRCKPVSGRAEVCNYTYGNNGWLGVATIWISGNHITQGTVKVNDTYFNTSTYNTSAWRNLVMCQEVGHIFGLDHQDENFYNTPLGTCMDYSNDPVPNQHPNQHDYDMLGTIYSHLDTTTTLSQSTASARQLPDVDVDGPREWGQEIRRSSDGRASLYERDLGAGQKILTHVFWADENQGRGRN